MTSPATSGPPAVSIVVPAFNSGRFLGETLRSIQRQSLTDWECVVVDDGSTDDTSAVARRFAGEDPRIRTATTENRGASAARNHGYLLTDPRSSYVTFMDSDDVWLPHALEALCRRLEVDPRAIGAHGLAERIDEIGMPVSTWSHSAHGRTRLGLEGGRLVVWPLDRPTTFDVLINGNVLFPPGLVLARRSVYERAGRFDEAITGGEDWDMLIRLSRYGYLSFVDEVILHYRAHESNLGAAAGIAQQAWLVRCKGFHSPENSAEQREIARRGWRAYQRYMIRQRIVASGGHLRTRRPGRCLDQLARIPVHAFRFVRGYPTPRLIRPSQPW
jgi:glycosyltransferase involved in cell wall biosynthesis